MSQRRHNSGIPVRHNALDDDNEIIAQARRCRTPAEVAALIDRMSRRVPNPNDPVHVVFRGDQTGIYWRWYVILLPLILARSSNRCSAGMKPTDTRTASPATATSRQTATPRACASGSVTSASAMAPRDTARIVRPDDSPRPFQQTARRRAPNSTAPCPRHPRPPVDKARARLQALRRPLGRPHHRRCLDHTAEVPRARPRRHNPRHRPAMRPPGQPCMVNLARRRPRCLPPPPRGQVELRHARRRRLQVPTRHRSPRRRQAPGELRLAPTHRLTPRTGTRRRSSGPRAISIIPSLAAMGGDIG